MKKKLKGSALLWSVCALLIVVFVLTGLLALNKTYAEEEINNIAARRAEYLARSGVELTADMITNKKLVGDTDIKTWVVSPDSEKKEDGTYINGTAPDEKKLEVVFSTDNGDIKVTVERIGDDVLSLKSFAEAGYMNRTVTAVMEYDNTQKTWELTGYATN